ncbi:MAG TPA: YceD family protein [Candidatus Saccharimonadia bacterium]|jgi:uncharacterized protein|nr:YceD family protein [Candidatus Saccharimonadia bacterium]
MHINVRDILVESVGYNQAYKIAGERPELEDVRLDQDIEGEITVSRLDESLLIRGQIQTAVQLECDRCLSTFTRPMTVSLAQEFAEHPQGDQLPIDDGEIDLAPLIGQELILSLPIKILDRPDCPGLKDVAGNYTNPADAASVKSRARITKGTPRGRT